MKRQTAGFAIVTAPLPMGDMGPFEATVMPHRYLTCYCGHQIWHGETFTGAQVFVCMSCKRVADVRRFG